MARVDVPGVAREDIRVEVSREELTISDRRASSTRAHGRFFRLIRLPAGAWPNRAQATVGGDVLEIRVPVAGDEATELGAPTGLPLFAFGAA